MGKRLFDIISSVVGILVLWPLILVIAVLIKFDSPGSALYSGIRIGKDGKQFRMHKFRSMVQNADKIGGPSTADDDYRLTKMGKFLKRFQLDELPQLFNVLQGSMSVVGPRPEVPQEVALYTKEERRLLSVRPGLTDWASLWNFHEGEILKGAKDAHETYKEKIRPEKIRLGLKYVDEHTMWIDINIILQTIKQIFS